MDTAQDFAIRWARLEAKLCRGEAWEGLSDIEKQSAREYLQRSFKTYCENKEREVSECTADLKLPEKRETRVRPLDSVDRR